MKKTLIYTVALLIISIMLFSMLPLSAGAADAHTLWLSPVGDNTDTTMPISAVKWLKRNEVYYFLMPAEAAGKRLQLWIEGTDTVTIDGGDYLYNKQSVGPLAAGNYLFTVGSTEYQVQILYSQNIGVMYITTESGNLTYIHADKSNKETGTMRMVAADGSKVYYDGELTQMKGRGNATWSKEKKPYQIKTKSKVELVEGAGKHKTWLLLANYLDQSMIRNSFVYDLANDVYQTPNHSQMQFVDLYCNNEYQGTYSVCEKVEIGDNRIEITDLEGATEDANPDTDLDSFERFGPNNAVYGSAKGYKIPNDPEDITGGYLLEVESHPRYENEVSGFVTTRGQSMVIKEPEYASEAQVAYISNYFQEFEDALYASDGVNPTTGKRYDEYFDLSSLVRRYILEELAMNIDANMTSQFFYKPSDSESAIGYAAPSWDYDNAMHNTNTSSITNWFAMNRGNAAGCKYFQQLKTHTDFNNALIAEWNANFLPYIREALGTEDHPGTYTRPIRSYADLLAPSAEINNICWNWNILKDLNYYEKDTGGPTYEGAVTFINDFIQTRSNWLSSQWNLNSIQPLTETESDQPLMVSMSDYTPNATYYTVSNEAELRIFADLLHARNSFEGKTVFQTADITLSYLSGTSGDTHERIGKVEEGTNPTSANDSGRAFRGTYNGQGYKIHNVVVTRDTKSGIGLFGAAYGATFIDVHVASGTITGATRVGGIVGMGDKCTFIRCSNGATIRCTGSENLNGTDAAGIAGIAREDSTFISCYNTGNIEGVTGLAGICGFSRYGTLTITNCYNTGFFSFDGKAEGSPIARLPVNTPTTFTDCYTLENVLPSGTQDQHVTPTFTADELTDGTLLNTLNSVNNVWKEGTDGPIHQTPVAAPTVSVTILKKLGDETVWEETIQVAKGQSVSLKEYDSYFNTSVTVNGTPTTAETLTANEDLTLVYQLKEMGPPISQLNGPGTYSIRNAEDLAALMDLTATQDLAGYRFYVINEIDAFTVTRTGGTFAGVLNGKGSTITGLTVPLFERVTGTVTKLTLKNACVNGGGAVANTNQGTISYVNTENLVIRNTDPAGGIVATNSGFIFACSVGGYVSSPSLAGGIAATNYGNLRNCLNTARIISDSGTVGGIAAVNQGNPDSCISRGILNAFTRHPVAPGTQSACFAWTDVQGTQGTETTVNDLTLLSGEFARNMNPIFWTSGTKSPVPKLIYGELGDVSGDDLVTAEDAALLLKYLVGSIPETDVVTENANLFGTEINSNDAACLLRHLLGKY